VKAVRAGWTSASFLLYAGALIVLAASLALLGVIASQHGKGAFAGYSALVLGILVVCAVGLRLVGARLAGGLFAFVSVGVFPFVLGAFFSWFGWFDNVKPIHRGFDWNLLLIDLLTILAALVAIRLFRLPLLVLIVAGVGWFFVTDLVSNGGNWAAWVTLIVGGALFLIGLGLDASAWRPYGFWVHVVAGLTVGGALLYFWHSSDANWALIIVTGLVFIAVGALVSRSSYAVLGVIGLALATGHFSVVGTFNIGGGVPHVRPWVTPLSYAGLGFFLAFLGLVFFRRGQAAKKT
jgi:hypothetical protein